MRLRKRRAASDKSLKSIVEEAREHSAGRAGEAMARLAEIAHGLEMLEINRRLENVREGLLSDTFQIIVVGRFKNGKSTLLNALLGRPTRSLPEIAGDHGPLPVDSLPATATLTFIRYAEEPYVRASNFEGETRDWTLERYLEESTVRLDEEENRRAFSNIRNFELGFPAELCQSGVTLVDSPGTDDVPHRTEITRQALDRADAAIVVFRSDALAGNDERQFVSRELLSTKTHIFTVVNLFHDQKVDERLEEATWQRVVTQMMDGPAYEGQDLREEDIYFVQSRDAEKGKLEGSAEKMESSGLLALEKRLGEFLVCERYRVHLEKFIEAALQHGAELERQVEKRRAGLERESAELEAAYEEIQPQLAAIHERRDKLPEILDRYRRECQRELQAGLGMMVRDLRRDLPTQLAEHEFEPIEGAGGFLRATFKQRALCEEMLGICTEIAKHRFDAWHKAAPPEAGAQQILEPILERMVAEISEEVGEIERGFGEIQLQMTGWQPSKLEVEGTVSLEQRVFSTIAGVLLQDASLALGGGLGGWRGLAGTVSGWLASGFGLSLLGSALGVMVAPVVIPAMVLGGLLGSMTWNRLGLEQRLHERTLEVFFAELDEIPGKVGPVVDREVARLFEETEEQVMEELGSTIASEEENITNLMRLNELSRQEKEEVLDRLVQARQEIARSREALSQVLLEAEQLGGSCGQGSDPGKGAFTASLGPKKAES